MQGLTMSGRYLPSLCFPVTVAISTIICLITMCYVGTIHLLIVDDKSSSKIHILQRKLELSKMNAS